MIMSIEQSQQPGVNISSTMYEDDRMDILDTLIDVLNVYTDIVTTQAKNHIACRQAVDLAMLAVDSASELLDK